VVVDTRWAQGLMAIVSGHYDIATKDKNGELEVAINSGIAIVTLTSRASQDIAAEAPAR
jgi:hypothetical protein